MSLLELLDAPGIHSTAQLATELGTTPEMVEAKLERYAQLGYVKKTVMSADCGGTAKMPWVQWAEKQCCFRSLLGKGEIRCRLSGSH